MRTVAVVDGNSLIHRAFHALPPTMTAPDGRPTNAAFGFMSMLVKLVADLNPDGLVVAFDRGKPAFRTEALAQYKIHRPPMAQELRDQFPMVKELLGAINVPIVEVDGWEGDDILGTLAKRGHDAGIRVLLVTGDRDAFQLVTENVCVVTTKKGITDIVVYGPAEVLERYGVTAEQVPDYLGLKGDTSDNIPGVPGVGEKTAAKLLQQYGTLEEVLAHAEEIPGKLGENLRNHVGEALASRTVATISRDVPMDLDMTTVEFGAFDPHAVAVALAEYRFTSMLDRVLALRRTAAVGAGTAVPGDAAAATRAIAPQGRGESYPAALATTVALDPFDHSHAVVSGPDALDRVSEWAAGEEWLGVVVDDGAGESLFGEVREVAVATAAGDVAYTTERDADAALSSLWASGRLAAADAKALLEEACPPDEALACDGAALAVAPDRLFDVAVAAYLLESNRSSYQLSALAADYLGSPLPEPTDELRASVIRAAATARLAPVLETKLKADDSLRVLREIEMPLVPVLARMERVGVGIDCDVLAGLSAAATGNIEELRAEIWELAGVEFTVDSPKQLSEVLFEKLGLPPQKRTKTGFSTDASVLAALAPAHPIAEKIVAYRELTKLKSTYLDALPRMLGGDKRLHTSFNQTVAATGRLSSSNPNLQNIPVRTEYGRRIRAAFVPASPGDVMVSADYSQIELRILAHLSGDPGLIEAFTSGMDFHMATAARVFGVEPEAVQPGMRARAKAVNFGIVYGQSAHGLAESLKISRAEGQEMIDRYYAAYPRVRAYLDETVSEAHKLGFATTLFGRKRRIPELASSNFNLRSFGERTAMNHPMQGTAADIMKLAMIEVDRRMRAEQFRSRMVLQVHDELVFESPADEVEHLSAMASEAMSGVAQLAVPLDVSVASGENWAKAK
ncbi:MAG: DNA polymerase I [Coriobacteriia bacterium]|nr:DNA polymerase I [Coriobacteriia bacterium]